MIAIIGVLVGLLIPAVQAARESARRSNCMNNLRQLSLGLINYEKTKQRLPPAFGYRPNPPTGSLTNNPFSWGARILEFIEEGSLASVIGPVVNTSTSLNSHTATVKNAVATPVATFRCPSDSSAPPATLFPGSTTVSGAVSCYVSNAGGFAERRDDNFCGGHLRERGDPTKEVAVVQMGLMWEANACSLADIADGTSKTILLGEVSWEKSQAQFALAVDNVDVWSKPAKAKLVERFGFIPLNADVAAEGDWGGTPDAAFLNNERRHTYLGWHSPHSSVVGFAMCDGSVRFINQTIDAGFPDYPSGSNTFSGGSGGSYLDRLKKGTQGNVPVLSRLSSRHDGMPTDVE